MKMTKIFATALPLCAAALLTGCNNASIEENIAPAAAGCEIPAVIVNEPDDTRAVVDGENFLVTWQKGDQITFFPCGDNNPHKATLADQYDGKTYGVFNCNLSIIGNPKVNHYGVFPHSGDNSLEEASQTIISRLATEQVYHANSFGGLNAYMTAYAPATANYTLNFQSYHGALGLRLKGDAPVAQIRITSDVENLAGKVRIATPYETAPAADAAEGSKSVTFDCSSVQLTPEAQPFCVALLPGTYTKLTVEILDVEGNELFKKTASKLTIRRNIIKMMKGEIELNNLVDHSKNPLLKWDVADLVYDKSNGTNSPASSYTVQGSLYQWGRNIGWSNYKDALGEQINNRFWGYATYNDFYYTGTGMYARTDHASYIAYEESSALSDFSGFYFMDPFGTDYWHSSFGDGGSTWDARAKKCGFTDNICPSGYHMPSKAEFLEIKPSAPLSGAGSLASVVNNRVELKKIEGLCTCAMRWSAETKSNKTYLRIDALVVPDSFTETNLSSIDWSDSNVVTRYFGANGFIHGFYHLHTIQNGTQVDNFPVARPMPGVETHNAVLKTTGDGNYYTITWDYITDYSVNNEGYYWMSDDKMAFTFQDNTRVKTVSDFSNRLSVFGTLPINAQDCCSIRCVKD